MKYLPNTRLESIVICNCIFSMKANKTSDKGIRISKIREKTVYGLTNELRFLGTFILVTFHGIICMYVVPTFQQMFDLK